MAVPLASAPRNKERWGGIAYRAMHGRISVQRWGEEGRRRYAALLAAAMRQAASDPDGRMTHDRSELLQGLRSLHLRHVWIDSPPERVKGPVHCLYYRPVESDLIEIIRVLHERMEPSLHLSASHPR